MNKFGRLTAAAVAALTVNATELPGKNPALAGGAESRNSFDVALPAGPDDKFADAAELNLKLIPKVLEAYFAKHMPALGIKVHTLNTVDPRQEKEASRPVDSKGRGYTIQYWVASDHVPLFKRDRKISDPNTTSEYTGTGIAEKLPPGEHAYALLSFTSTDKPLTEKEIVDQLVGQDLAHVYYIRVESNGPTGVMAVNYLPDYGKKHGQAIEPAEVYRKR